MVIELSPGSWQPDLGLDTKESHTAIPLAEVKLGIPGTRAFGELMAIQYASDTSKEIVPDTIHDRLSYSKWAAISLRNPQYSKEVMEIQKAMKDARILRSVLDWADPDYEMVMNGAWGCFEEVEDPNTQAVLRDVLRLYVVASPDHVYEYAEIIEAEVLAVFPEETEGDDSHAFEKVSAGDLFRLMLEGKLTLPGYKIQPKGGE